MDQVECVVVGAGVVGLASAAAIARSGKEVLVLEAESAIGTHCSSRNSGVIHAGIYYDPGSLKAKLCVSGKHALYRYAKERGIDHQKTGKLIVATSPDQLPHLKAIRHNAEINGLTDVDWLTGEEVNQLEPEVLCHAALYSPSTGIIDSHGLMLALQGDLESENGMVVLNTQVASVSADLRGFVIETSGESSTHLRTKYLINASGLFAPDLARQINGLSPANIPEARYAIGHYYRLSGASPCKRLVYPVPEPGGLGIHLTLDLGGQARFGPDVRWIDKVDYSFDDSRKGAFSAAIRKYLPCVTPARLSPDYTGIRPKISARDDRNADFRLDGPAVHGVHGLVNLFGIESPGLTASLAIADHVAALID